MKYSLTLPFSSLIEKFNSIIEAANLIIQDTTVSGKKLYEFNNEITAQVNIVLEQSIRPNAKVFIKFFYNNSDLLFYDFLKSKDDTHDAEFEKSEIERKINCLRFLIEMLGLVNSFTESDGDNVVIHGITEKKDFLLEKLHKVFNDKFYSISSIFRFNDIKFRDNETEELAEDLNKKGYVHRESDYKGDAVKLTIKGASYIERKLKQRGNKKVLSDDLYKKLDEITKRLKALGFGQEIIFNEIEELRDLQSKLSKKTWSQVLKGKLLDLGLEQAINKETAFMIYEFLTNDKLKLM
ncbi:hypothetical protein FNO01nite_26280 [Flavobacterium noncentrifugens]|uniref:Uncharacterized protein n=1 Tax=Flavobacterium noncentrifugens TaxID=1128970 RepID=A0A1G8ZFQ2_9FLAO|nr:hypothetical protein [Flavobacterium noncentrifugens]GEP51956.1 hypothetical protein FNO01nite_26280 [Flavobacterium noncentrifugens]SDK13847.1 hypothetical protein SAMN04487935_2571 [Flavobacterium noncentrifugens]